MSVSALVTRGFGPAGTINTLPTRGLGVSEAVAGTNVPGVEFTAIDLTLQFAAHDNRMQFTAPTNRLQFAARDEDL